MTTTCYIASFLLHIRPHRIAGVKAEILVQHQVEATVEAEDPTGRLAVVVETSHRKAVEYFYDLIQRCDGVLSAALIYSEQVEEESLQ